MSKNITFTKHAKQRCHEYGLRFSDVSKNFNRAKRVQMPRRVWLNNLKFYPWKNNKKIQYRWSNGVLYTVDVRNTSRTIITVTPKKKEEVNFSS